MVPPGRRDPSRSAASMIRTAIRSFTEPPGFTNSTFASTVADSPAVTVLRRTSGVSPIRSRTFAAYRICFLLARACRQARSFDGCGSGPATRAEEHARTLPRQRVPPPGRVEQVRVVQGGDVGVRPQTVAEHVLAVH